MIEEAPLKQEDLMTMFQRKVLSLTITESNDGRFIIDVNHIKYYTPADLAEVEIYVCHCIEAVFSNPINPAKEGGMSPLIIGKLKKEK